jgi:arginine-tRNA-protein transferase
MARLLEHIVEPPRECVYLPDRDAVTETRLLIDVSPAELGAMLERGWRRFGPAYFRPMCEPCQECVSIRIPVARFSPNKSQRRALRSARRLRRVVGTPDVDEQRLELYHRWHAQREEARGWPPDHQTRQGYAMAFAFPHPSAREVSFWDGEKLVGVGIWDEVPGAASAAYFFSDPDYARLSLGTGNVMTYLEDARDRGLAYVYLGYRVAACRSLAYKGLYEPHELLVGRPSFEEEPIWRAP